MKQCTGILITQFSAIYYMLKKSAQKYIYITMQWMTSFEYLVFYMLLTQKKINCNRQLGGGGLMTTFKIAQMCRLGGDIIGDTHFQK